MKNILIIEDDVVFSRSISNWLKKKGMATGHVPPLEQPVRNFRLRRFDLVLADLRLPDGSSMELLKWMKGKHYSIPFLIMTSYGQVGECGGSHAAWGFQSPLQAGTTGPALGSHRKEFSRLGSMAARNSTVVKVKMPCEMYRLIGPVARSDMSVLLRGASGTGKGTCCRRDSSGACAGTCLFAVDCGAVSG